MSEGRGSLRLALANWRVDRNRNARAALLAIKPAYDKADEATAAAAKKDLPRARALAAEPKILLLDEPAAGLNASETGEIDQLIQNFFSFRKH